MLTKRSVASGDENETPSESQKLRPKTPSESQKLRPKTPSESQKLRPKTPSESQKLRPKTPSKSQKLRPKTPSESQKLRPKTPSESQKLRPKTPSKSQKLRPKIPSESQKLRPKTPSESQKLRPIFPWISSGVSWKANKLFGFGAWAFSRSDSRAKNNVHHTHQPAMWPVNKEVKCEFYASMTFTVDRNGKHYLSLVSDYFLFCVYFLRFRWYATWETKHSRKRFQNFRQSCVLSTDRIEIHQSQLVSRDVEKVSRSH